jgi:hypothetical protein
MPRLSRVHDLVHHHPPQSHLPRHASSPQPMCLPGYMTSQKLMLQKTDSGEDGKTINLFLVHMPILQINYLDII